MLLEAIVKPICYRWPGGEVVLMPGCPLDLPEDRAWRVLQRAPGKVRAIDSVSLIGSVRAGRWVEWLSPALPRQQGEVLAVHPDGTFEAFHPITEAVCRMPVAWVIRVMKAP